MLDHFEDFYLLRPRSAKRNPNVFLGAFNFFLFIEQVPSFSYPGSTQNIPAASSAYKGTISEPPSRQRQRGDEDACNSS